MICIQQHYLWDALLALLEPGLRETSLTQEPHLTLLMISGPSAPRANDSLLHRVVKLCIFIGGS